MGGGANWKPEILLEENKEGGRRSGDVSPKGKRKELEAFPDGPLFVVSFNTCPVGVS